MSFLNITDPKRRDELVREYAKTVKTIQDRNLNTRLHNTIDEKNLEKMFLPVVKANESVSSTITKELTPLKRDLESLTDSIKKNPPTKSEKKDDGDSDDSSAEDNNIIAAYYLAAKRKGKDTVYGIHVNPAGKLQMGDKVVFIQENNIIVDNTIYPGTEGLWTLVMDTKPNRTLYTEKDLKYYIKLLHHTSVIFEPNEAGSRNRPRTTTKWKQTIEPLLKDNNISTGEGICSHQQKQRQPQQKQIAYLPGDVSGLKEKMKVLLAEFLAGNKTTRTELVSVLDQLKRLRKISKTDFDNTNLLLSEHEI